MMIRVEDEEAQEIRKDTEPLHSIFSIDDHVYYMLASSRVLTNYHDDNFHA